MSIATIAEISNSYNNNYSTVNNNIKLQYSNVDILKILSNSFNDITEEQYYPFYVNRFKDLGSKRFTELANVARKSSDTPVRLFNWFLKNPELVRY